MILSRTECKADRIMDVSLVLSDVRDLYNFASSLGEICRGRVLTYD